MRHSPRHIALLLVVAQSFAALGFGPRAICHDPDGSSCTDSAASPCCCFEHRGPACCDDQNTDGPAPAQLVAAGCGCVHTPIADQPFVARHRDVKRDLGLATMHAAALPHVVLRTHVLPSPACAWRGPKGVGPPGGSGLAHIDTVILRL